jgi:hypothetical protein
VSTLTKEEGQEVISQADAKLKRAKGKSLMPQLTKEQLRQLLQDVLKGDDGLISFHDLQKAVLKVRTQRRHPTASA